MGRKNKKPNRYNIIQPQMVTGSGGTSGLVAVKPATRLVAMLDTESKEGVIEEQDLQSKLSQLQAIDPIHQRDILELEAELREAETKYNDAMTKAATETDPAKKAQFIAAAQVAEQTIRQIKAKLANNPLSKLAQYSYINNIGRLLNGNVPSSLPGNRNSTNGSNSNSNVIKSKKKKQQQQQMLLLLLLAVAGAYYFMIYLPEEEAKKLETKLQAELDQVKNAQPDDVAEMLSTLQTYKK
ncbi:13742_t:CDS:2 [Funneliformis geosporum]|nr:13742_t:CDS:2 [Funneliformis geosporum]